jgi:hypothetical protein
VYNGTCGSEQEFPVHVVIGKESLEMCLKSKGMAGCGLSQNTWSTTPTWIEKVDIDDYGFTTISTTDKTLHMQYFTNTNPDVAHDDFILYL